MKYRHYYFGKPPQVDDLNEVLTLFHHIHHEDGEHEVHHCGGAHADVAYTISHCPCGEHSIDKQSAVGHATDDEELEQVEIEIRFMEKCPDGGWHVESGIENPDEPRAASLSKENAMKRTPKSITYRGAQYVRVGDGKKLSTYEEAWEAVGPGLKRAADDAVQALKEDLPEGFTVEGPDESLSDTNEYMVEVLLPDNYTDEGIGIDFSLKDAADYKDTEPGEEGWGVNVSVSITAYPSGLILSSLTGIPDDAEELKSRIDFVDQPYEVAAVALGALKDELEHE